MSRPPHARRRAAAALLALAVLAVDVTLASAAVAAPRETFHGRYVLTHSDDFSHGRATFEPSLELEDGTVVGLDFRGPAPRVRPGTALRVEGAEVGGQIVVAEGGAEVDTTTSSPVPAGVTKSVAVVMLNFSNDAAEPYSKAYAEGVAFTNVNSVAAYYQEASWGNLTLTGDVYGWYPIADDNGGCDFSTWGTQAMAAAEDAGVNLDGYDYVAFAFPQTSSCGWAGLAYLPGRYSYLNGTGAMGLRVFAHELGHNLGTHHASTLSCVMGGVRLSLTADLSGCTSNEYGDPFTVMGASTKYQHTNFSRGNAGWLQGANTQTVTATGDYALAPIGPNLPTQVQSLRVQRAANSYLTLEFRQPSGTQFDTFAANAPVVNGVTIRITPGYATRSQSQLVDATPATSTYADAPLAVGQTLTDPATDVSVTTLSVGAAGASVRISFGDDPPPPPPDDTAAPSVPGGFGATPTSDRRIALSWSASTDAVGVTGYRVYRDGSLVAVVTGTSYADTGLTPVTTYAYAVQAVDAASNASAMATASATTLPTPDTRPPKRPRKPKADRTAGRAIELRWAATTDDVGVTGYVVFRGAHRIATVAGRRYVDHLPRAGMHPRYRVRAFDAAGNLSRRSRPTQV